jgi:glycosyltransferase involved in cell wall biosynthesis
MLAYNHSKYIARAIEGVLMQETDYGYELLIHDDASPDNTAKIISTYQKKYPRIIKPIYQKENQYSKDVYISRKLIEDSRGRYIAFCEGDDYWTDKRKLQKQVDFLENNDEYVATFHWANVVDKSNNNIDSMKSKFMTQKTVYKLVDWPQKHMPSHINTIVVRADVRKEVFKIWDKFTELTSDDVKKIAMNDYFVSLGILLQGDMYGFKEVMSCYRYVREIGATNAVSRAIDKNYSYIYYIYYDMIERNIKKYYGIKMSLTQLKTTHLINSISFYLKRPSLENKQIILAIIHFEKNWVEIMNCLIVRIFKYPFRRINRMIQKI